MRRFDFITSLSSGDRTDVCVAQAESQLNTSNDRVKATEGASCDDEGSRDRSLFVVCFVLQVDSSVASWSSRVTLVV